MPTGELNRVFEQILHVHQPPVVSGRRLKIYYVTQVAYGPPRFVIWCNNANGVHFSYRRFLVNRFRMHWDFEGTPLKLHVRERTRRTAVPEELLDRAREADATAEADELFEMEPIEVLEHEWVDEARDAEDAADRDRWNAPEAAPDDWVSATWEALGADDEDEPKK